MNTLRILCVGKIVNGPIDWTIAPLPVDEADAKFDAPSECSYFAHLMPVDGELQRLIDEAEMTAEYEDYLIDVEYMRSWH